MKRVYFCILTYTIYIFSSGVYCKTLLYSKVEKFEGYYPNSSDITQSWHGASLLQCSALCTKNETLCESFFYDMEFRNCTIVRKTPLFPSGTRNTNSKNVLYTRQEIVPATATAVAIAITNEQPETMTDADTTTVKKTSVTTAQPTTTTRQTTITTAPPTTTAKQTTITTAPPTTTKKQTTITTAPPTTTAKQTTITTAPPTTTAKQTTITTAPPTTTAKQTTMTTAPPTSTAKQTTITTASPTSTAKQTTITTAPPTTTAKQTTITTAPPTTTAKQTTITTAPPTTTAKQTTITTAPPTTTAKQTTITTAPPTTTAKQTTETTTTPNIKQTTTTLLSEGCTARGYRWGADMCFQVYLKSSISVDNAEIWCRETLQGDLISLDSELKFSYFADYVNDNFAGFIVILGLRSENITGPWLWNNNSQMNMSKFCPYEPNGDTSGNHIERCAVLNSGLSPCVDDRNCPIPINAVGVSCQWTSIS